MTIYNGQRTTDNGQRTTKMNIVVTGGGTVAPLDDVRLLTNVSSGRLAAAITESFLEAGASVWHIHARSALVPVHRHARLDLDAADPSAEMDRLMRLRRRWVEVRDRLHLVPLGEGTVADYATTLRTTLEARPIDVAVLTMAVSDYEPGPQRGKIRSDDESLVIRCRRTPKVIRSVRDWAPSIYLVGFKLLSDAPHDELIRRAEEACRINRADLTVANDLRTLKQGRHTLHLVRPGAAVETLEPGDDLADRLVARIVAWADPSRRDRPPGPRPPSS
jgi:phosphopantothenate-cysteine ligase